MDRKSSQIHINLSGKKKVLITGNVLKWAVTFGRIIIVGTELLALGALLYRFTIDRKIIDLHDQIKKNNIFVVSQEAKEKEYRAIQSRLSNIKNIDTETQVKIKTMNDILVAVSDGSFSNTNFTINQNTIGLSGTAFSVFTVNSLIDDLKQNPNIISISLDELTSAEAGIQFRLNIELKQITRI